MVKGRGGFRPSASLALNHSGLSLPETWTHVILSAAANFPPFRGVLVDSPDPRGKGMVGIGIAGIGFMGMIHYLAAEGLAGGRVSAICSRDGAKRTGDWTGIQGNFGPPGRLMDLSGVRAHAEFDALLADPAVNLIDLCVPVEQHAPMAIRALEAGKAVLVEKPIASTLVEADAMLDAASRTGSRLMVAHVLPFFAEFAFARETVNSGQYGSLRAFHLTRVVATPDPSAAAEAAVDLHIHDSHFVSLLCGCPRAVRSIGRVEQGAVTYLSTHYQFANDRGPVVSATSGVLGRPGRPFAHGFELYLDGANLTFSLAAMADGTVEGGPLAVSRADGQVLRPKLDPGDPISCFQREMAAAIGVVATGRIDPALDAGLAREALATCLAEVNSVREGRAVEIT